MSWEGGWEWTTLVILRSIWKTWPHPTPAHPLVLSMLKSVLLLTCMLSSPPHSTPPFCLKYPQVCLAPDLYVINPSPPHKTPPFGLIYAQVCPAPDLYVIIPIPPHPTWAQILDFVGTSETNTCRYKWVKSVGASEPLPSLGCWLMSKLPFFKATGLLRHLSLIRVWCLLVVILFWGLRSSWLKSKPRLVAATIW